MKFCICTDVLACVRSDYLYDYDGGTQQNIEVSHGQECDVADHQ